MGLSWGVGAVVCGNSIRRFTVLWSWSPYAGVQWSKGHDGGTTRAWAAGNHAAAAVAHVHHLLPHSFASSGVQVLSTRAGDSRPSPWCTKF